MRKIFIVPILLTAVIIYFFVLMRKIDNNVEKLMVNSETQKVERSAD
jgi:uncharacterized membrane protein